MPTSTDIYISQSFSNLHTLIIDECCWDLSSFYFGNLSLSYLELRYPISEEEGEKVLVVTLWNNKKRWYSTNKVSEANPHPTGDPRNFPAVESLPYNKYVGIPSPLSLSCVIRCMSLFWSTLFLKLDGLTRSWKWIYVECLIYFILFYVLK
jgi:hypothetical protein